MKLIFRSNELEREIPIESVHEMEHGEARRFHTELTMAVLSMDDSIRDAQWREHEAGIPFDRDWMHKARKKRRITLAFASEAKRRLLKLEGVEEVKQRRTFYEAQREKFHIMRHDRLREMLKEELGPGVLEEMEAEAHETAEKQFAAWLDEESFERFYIP